MKSKSSDLWSRARGKLSVTDPRDSKPKCPLCQDYALDQWPNYCLKHQKAWIQSNVKKYYAEYPELRPDLNTEKKEKACD